MKLPEQMTTVTPFSKALALSLFIILPLLTFILGIEYEKKVGTTHSLVQDRMVPPLAPTTPVTTSVTPDTPITSDIDNTFTTNRPLRYSFKHLEGYKVVHVNGYNYRVIKASVNEDDISAYMKTVENDPEVLDISFVNYYTDTTTKPGTPIEAEHIEKWMKTSGLTASQCAVNRKVSTITFNTTMLYKVDIICDYGSSTTMYLLEADATQGEYVLVSGDITKKQFASFLNTFKVLK